MDTNPIEIRADTGMLTAVLLAQAKRWKQPRKSISVKLDK